MIKSQELMTLQRSTSTSSSISSRKMIVPVASNHMRSNSSTIPALAFTTTNSYNEISDRLLIPKHSPVSLHHLSKTHNKISSLLRSLLNLLSFPTLIPTCKWLRNTHLSITPTLGRKVTGTLFGNRRGHVNFAVQLDPRSPPLLLLELAMSTSSLVKEMSSGLVRIALESEKVSVSVPGKTTTTTTTTTTVRGRKLFQEPAWTMYCNGRKCGLAVSRACVDFDWHVLSTIRSVSVGAGVIPVVDDGQKGAGSEGELLYMRARFERVVGSRDSEAFYMMNPDGNGGPELSIFLLRI